MSSDKHTAPAIHHFCSSPVLPLWNLEIAEVLWAAVHLPHCCLSTSTSTADSNLITKLTPFQDCLKGLFSTHGLGEQLFINHFKYSQETYLVWHFIKSFLTQTHPPSEVLSCGFRLHLCQSNEKCFLNPAVSLPPVQHWWGLMDPSTYYKGS